MVLSGSARGTSARLRATLERGGIAIIACDTIYGIVGRAPEAEARIRSVKGRGEDKPFLILVASKRDVRRYSNLPLDPRLASLWPGPLTLIVPARGEAASRGATVALRVPADRALRGLIRRIGTGLYSTSVNRSGKPALESIAEIVREFERDVDLIVNSGDAVGRLPSTILDATSRPYRIVRQGALAIPPALLME